MSNVVPFIQGPVAVMQPTIQALPDGQSQLVHIVCTPESYEFLLERFRTWFDGEDWDHVVLVSHSDVDGTAKQGLAFFVLEWQESLIDAFFLRILETEESVIDFTTFIREEV